MAAALWVVKVAEDPEFTAGTIRVAACLARHSDENGAIIADQSGEPITDYRSIASALGLGESTVYKAIAALDEAGYLKWSRARGSERLKGVSGRIHLDFSSAP